MRSEQGRHQEVATELMQPKRAPRTDNWGLEMLRSALDISFYPSPPAKDTRQTHISASILGVHPRVLMLKRAMNALHTPCESAGLPN